ncbi:hypothetical protein EVAR_16676_1 [Eumeta japonica]|uniref:Uncharacterized protein n=1 Tax=Eumeta variegata TaxID=151549 RepID=A0A4C1V562_EUMVA|nr:hypothetical protein EVAR_16676_1 [Eumeta japonica]
MMLRLPVVTEMQCTTWLQMAKAGFTVTISKPKDSLLSIEILTHSPCSPNLASYDFYLFSKMKKKLRGKRFTDAEETVAVHEKNLSNGPNLGADDETEYCNTHHQESVMGASTSRQAATTAGRMSRRGHH